MYIEVLVIAEHLDNILFCHYSKIIFEYDSLAIFAGITQNTLPPPPVIQETKRGGGGSTVIGKDGITLTDM